MKIEKAIVECQSHTPWRQGTVVGERVDYFGKRGDVRIGFQPLHLLSKQGWRNTKRRGTVCDGMIGKN